MNLEFLKNLTVAQKAGALGLILVLLVVVFYWLFVIPKNNKVRVLENDIATIERDIGVNRAKANKLEQLKLENKELERALLEKQKQLPPEAEVANLLKQVSDLGLRAGLDFKLWRPQAKQAGPEGLYDEIPVDVEIAGSYHTIGLFFDSVRNLPRIVNIKNIQMKKGTKNNKGKFEIQTSFKATAFTASEPVAAPADEKGAKPGTKKPSEPAGGGGH